MALNGTRKNFAKYFSGVFENYLVNEFIYNFYPWKHDGDHSIRKNFASFLAAYKIIETFTFSVTAFNFQQSDSVFAGLIAGYKMNIVIMISNLAHLMDHNKAYTDTIEKNFEDNNDTLKIMSAFLQTD